MFFQHKGQKKLNSRGELQVKIDYGGTVLKVLNLKGHKIAQLAQKISSLLLMDLFFGHFWCEKL